MHKIKESDQPLSPFSSNSCWPRLSKYEAIEGNDGFLYVMPSPGSSLVSDNFPFINQKDLLQDFIYLGKFIDNLIRQYSVNDTDDDFECYFVNYKEEDEEDEFTPPEYKIRTKKIQMDIKTKVLGFCNKYGILGLFFRDYLDYEPLFFKFLFDTGSVYIDESDTEKPKDIDIFPKKIFGSGDVTFGEYICRYHPNPISNDFKGFSLLNWYKYIGERVLDIGNAAVLFYGKFYMWSINKNGNDDYRYIIEKFLSVDHVGIQLSYNRGWQIEWHYNSLLEAIEIMLLLDIANQKYPLKLCENEICPKIFRPKTKNQKWCSRSCNDYANQQIFQEKIRQVKAMYKEGKPINEIAAELKNSPDQVKRWLGID